MLTTFIGLKSFSSQITAFANIQQLTNVDILGYSSLGFKKEAKIRDIIVNELNQ